MNFFGHAAVASWRSAPGEVAPGIVFGAMLPDFETMSGARVARVTDANVVAGIELHHATDGVFHQLPVVTGLMRELDARLLAGNCARGPRRAVAHIGVELLLDGVLVDDAGYRDAFLRGVAHEIGGMTQNADSTSDPVDAVIEWRDDGDDSRFATLLSRMRTYGVPFDLREPEAIARRMQRMLSHRPLLAPSPTDLVAIRTALVEHKPRVTVATDTVIRALRAALVV